MKPELTGVEEIDRGLKWKRARKAKEEGAETPSLKEAFEKIDDCIRDVEAGTFNSNGSQNDLLTCALGKPEHSGRVRGIGAYVTPTTYFKIPRERRKKTDDKTVHELDDAKKKIEEQGSELEKYNTRMHLQDKVIYELVDRIGKLEALVESKEKTSLIEDKGSCSVQLSQHKDAGEVIYIDKSTTLQGKKVAILMLGSNKAIVGYGTVVVLGDKIHGRPMPEDSLRVSVDEVLDENALLPFPISDDIYSVGSALGTHVAWPSKLVELKEAKVISNSKIEKDICSKNMNPHASLPAPLKALYRVMENDYKNGKGLRLPVDIHVFGSDIVIWILQDIDLVPFCKLEPITGNCIVVYIWHLYKQMVKNNQNARFFFVNPFTISYTEKSSPLRRAHNLAERLSFATSNQLVFVPCNVGEHWILTIIEPHKEYVYLMYPLTHEKQDATWKYVVDTTMVIYNVTKKKPFTKPPKWEIIKGPMQPDSKQCGYYVMRFMKLIVEGVQKDFNGPIRSMFKEGVYSKCEIDEVREDWATCLIECL